MGQIFSTWMKRAFFSFLANMNREEGRITVRGTKTLRERQTHTFCVNDTRKCKIESLLVGSAKILTTFVIRCPQFLT